MMPSNHPSAFQLFRPHLLALLLYCALSMVSLNNLVLHFATALPGVGGYDYSVFYWNLWWVKYALFNLHRDPMFSNYALYPNTVNLSLHTLGFTLGLFTAPLQPFLDLKLIYNGTLVGSFIASGYCTYLFLNRHVQNRWLAILGGALFAFTPSTIDHASNGHLHLLATWWIPLSLLLWDGVIARRGMRWRVIAAGGLGLTFYLAWMSGLEPLMWSVLLWAPYALYTWMTQCQGPERMRVLGLALVTGAVMLGPAMIEPIPAMLQTRGISFPRASLDTAQSYSYRLEWLFSRDPDRLGDSIGQLVPFLTLLSLPLGGRHQRWLWLGIGLGLFILALGPRLQGTNIPLPYLVLHNLLDGQYRMPERFMTPATSALAAFIILSLDNLFERRISLRWLPWLSGVCIVGLVFDSGMLSPFPTRFMPDYRIYHEIGRDPAEYTLMEVPVSPASGFTQIGPAPDLQYYAYIHHKRLITGFISRLPGDGLDRYWRSPLIRGLSSDYALPPLDVAATEMADKLNRWDIRYVLVHRDRLNQEHAPGIIAFLNVQPELCLVDAEGDLLAYRRINTWADCPRPEMSALPSGTSRLTLGQSGDERYVGPGWYDVENIGGPQGRWAGGMLTSTLRLLLPKQSLRVSFNALAYPPDQSVTVRVNGQPVAHFELSEAWQVYQFDLPAGALPDTGPALIELVHAKLLPANQRTNGQSPDQRPLAAAYSWIEFTPQ
jgi:hypothetical protein